MPKISFDEDQGVAVYDGTDEITFSRQPYAISVKGYSDGKRAIIENFHIVNLYKPNFRSKVEHLYELWCFLNGKSKPDNFVTSLLFGKRRSFFYSDKNGLERVK